MKTNSLLLCGTLALASVAAAAPAVHVYGKGYYNDKTVVLHVIADSQVPLRSFGIRLAFDPSAITPRGVNANPALWFLAAQPGQRSPYQPDRPGPDWVRVVGARFEGAAPGHGVIGDALHLFSLWFQREDASLPKFEAALAGPSGFASFVTTGGLHVDDSVDGLGTWVLSFQPLPTDSDGDGIPDQVELAWFGTLDRANADTDNDGDGVKDIDEWIGGTNAADPNSVTRLVLTLDPAGRRLLTWTGQTGRVYDLLRSPDLVNFIPLAEGLVPGSPNTFLDEQPEPLGFYRLRIAFPEGDP